MERHVEEFQFDFSISRFPSNRPHFVKCPESSRKPNNCNVPTTYIMSLARSAIANQEIVGDESERNVDSPSIGLRSLKC